MKKLFLILSVLLIYSCKTSPDPDVEFEWLVGTRFNYSYMYGTIVGGTWYNYFKVTNGSGDVTFKIYVNGSKKESITVTVEEGLSYSISIKVTIGRCWGSNSSNAEIKSSSVDTPKILNTDCEQLTIGEISVSEYNN